MFGVPLALEKIKNLRIKEFLTTNITNRTNLWRVSAVRE